MSDPLAAMLDLVKPCGLTASILTIICIFLAWQLERERRERAKDRSDLIELFERMIGRRL